MMASVNPGWGTSGLGAGLNTQGMIARLLEQIKVLQKQMHDIQKKMLDTPDPDTRKILRQQLEDIAKFVQMIQMQILQLETAEQQKQAMKHQAELKQALKQQLNQQIRQQIKRQ